jgi:nicotinate-nucleotide adenylyltransferase
VSAPRIGIFGGSFNPVHLGHLIPADDARAALGLDRVLFVPARVPPHKGAADLLDGDERAALIEAALAGEPAFEVSRADLDRDGPSYTVETIRIVRETLPEGAEVFLMMGSDSLADLPSWRSPDEILRLARVAVFPRPGHDPAAAPPQIRRSVRVLETPLVGISAQSIRDRIRAGRPFRYLVPDAVWRRIVEKGHYRAG